jgi:peptidoglycan/LPS O-acetylase OafA/YrhL
MNYRKEIDGLRAIAVCTVILYHAGFEAFSGGYVGVDIFFVISGFLIFGLILKELSLGVFSFSNFYQRRIKRILPALFLVIFCTTVPAYLILIPEDFAAYSRSVISTSLFIPNILFWRETGYFNANVELKPLLHMWSLGVEEQFYIIFPVVLVFIYKWARRCLIPFFVLTAFMSLLFAEQIVLSNPAAAFFLLPTRIWEFLCGGLIAMLFNNYNFAPPNKIVAEIAMLLGIILIGAAVFTFDNSTPVPSMYLLLPIIGTMLVLVFGEQETKIGALLRSRPFIFLGLTSYSTYLWHQPILALVRQESLATPGLLVIMSCLVATLLMGFLSWRFFEMPIRRYNLASKTKVFVIAFCVSSLFISFGSIVHLKNGFEANYTADFDLRQQSVWNSSKVTHALTNDCRYLLNADNPDNERFDNCHQRYGAAIVIMGGSHGMDFFNAFLTNSGAPFVVGLVNGGCRPYTPLPECNFDVFKRFISSNVTNIQNIIYKQIGLELLLDKHNLVALPDFNAKNKNQSYSINVKRINLVINYLKSLGADQKIIWLGPSFFTLA